LRGRRGSSGRSGAMVDDSWLSDLGLGGGEIWLVELKGWGIGAVWFGVRGGVKVDIVM
jgi:hypothetical protein